TPRCSRWGGGKLEAFWGDEIEGVFALGGASQGKAVLWEEAPVPEGTAGLDDLERCDRNAGSDQRSEDSLADEGLADTCVCASHEEAPSDKGRRSRDGVRGR